MVSGSQDIDGWREDGMVDVHGHVDGRFGPVRERFTEVIDGQPGTGAAFAAWCDGWLVADLWGGAADLGGRPWDAGSLVQPYSVSKPFVAVCALRLVEAGGLDLDAPASHRLLGPGMLAEANHRVSPAQHLPQALGGIAERAQGGDGAARGRINPTTWPAGPKADTSTFG